MKSTTSKQIFYREGDFDDAFIIVAAIIWYLGAD